MISTLAFIVTSNNSLFGHVDCKNLVGKTEYLSKDHRKVITEIKHSISRCYTTLAHTENSMHWLGVQASFGAVSSVGEHTTRLINSSSSRAGLFAIQKGGSMLSRK